MKHLLLILPFITQWSFFNNGELVLTADETSLDSVTVDMRLTEDLTFALRQTRTSLIISPSDNDRTYMWQIVDRNSLNNMAQMVGRKSITPEEFWQYYIYLFFDSRYDLDCGTVELNYADYAITPGSYDVVIAGCDTLGYRTSDFTIRHINVRTTAPEKLYAAEPASTDTLYYFLLSKDGRQVAELPSTSVDSITVRQVTKPVNLDLAVTDVGKTRATISVTPSYPVPYYFDYLPASVFETYPDDETFVSQYLEFLKATHQQDLESILSYGPDSYTFTEDGLETFATATATEENLLYDDSGRGTLTFNFVEDDPIFGEMDAPIVLDNTSDYLITITGFEQLTTDWTCMFSGADGFEGFGYAILEDGSLATVGYTNALDVPQVCLFISFQAALPVALVTESCKDVTVTIPAEGGYGVTVYDEEEQQWYNDFDIYTMNSSEWWEEIEAPGWVSIEYNDDYVERGLMAVFIKAGALPKNVTERHGDVIISLYGKEIVIPVAQGDVPGAVP